MRKNKKQAFIVLYEVAQIDLVASFFGLNALRDESNFLIVPLDYEIEMRLVDLKVPFLSLRDYSPRSSLKERIQKSGKLMRCWYDSPELSFFTYKDIRLGEIVEYSLGEYLLRVLYYLDIILYILDSRDKVSTIYVPESLITLSPTVGQLAQFEISIPVDVLKTLECIYGFDLQIISGNIKSVRSSSVNIFLRKVSVVLPSIVLRTLGFLVGFFRKKNALRLFVSDYWWHISPFVSLMSDVEVTMMDRREIKNAKNFIWSNKIQFYQIKNFITPKIKRRAKEIQNLFLLKWKDASANPSYLKEFEYQGINFFEVVRPVYGYLVGSFSSKIIESIDGAEQLLKEQKPQAVILRASVSGQIHFSILSFVSRALGIPSIELQHGLEYMDPISHSVQKPVDFLASYGPVVKREIERANTSRLQVLNIGSPRFDQYLRRVISEEEKKSLQKKLGIDPCRPAVLFIAPDIVVGQTYDSYDSLRVFQDLSSLCKIKGVQIIIKLRPGPEREFFFKKVLEDTFGGQCIVAQYENMQELFSISTLVISCFSTVSIEAMIAQKPLILDGANANDLMLIESHFLPYEKAQALFISRSSTDLTSYVEDIVSNNDIRESLVSSANIFLKENYCFDGYSSERIRDFLETLRK